jgi:hypothetical protein
MIFPNWYSSSFFPRCCDENLLGVWDWKAIMEDTSSVLEKSRASNLLGHGKVLQR